MSIRQFLVNLVKPDELNRRVQSPGSKTSDEYAQEIKIETERRRGMYGGACSV